MLLRSGGGSVMAVTCWPSRRVTCFASSNLTTEQLRSQLDHLHSEADTARAKANNARMRLLRLSEAAENLKRQAAISVRSGKEDDAREILFQKKKVMEALEKSKTRIELLDELSSKLQEAISLKEKQLIGNVALDLGAVKESFSSSVRIVSPVPEAKEYVAETDDPSSNDIQSDKSQESQFGSDNRASVNIGLKEHEDVLESEPVVTESSLERVTSFGVFLNHMDEQLTGIESELVTVLRVSTLLLDGEEKTKNFRVQQTMELLESIRVIRKRISDIRLVEAESR